MTKVFVAYPSTPNLGDIMRRLKDTVGTDIQVTTWERTDLAGQDLIAPVVKSIKESDIVLADITSLNFNVTYELGFAIELGKRVIPIRNSAYNLDGEAIQQIGIYDTLLREEYTGASDLVSILARASVGQRLATNFPTDPTPLYIVLPTTKTDDVGQIKDRAQRAGLRSRVFDPTETPRLGPTEAVRAVAVSTGVIIPLMSPDMREATIHNIRAAFVAGLSHAMDRPTLVLRKGLWAVPLDVRDVTETYHSEGQLASLIGTFAGRVNDVLFSRPASGRHRANHLSELNLGDPAAENEESQLAEYFLERGEFRQVVDQRANIVVGRKGSGKTAVFVRSRDLLKEDRSKVVIDLSPQTHELKRLKDLVLDCLAAGSKEFLLSAFWDYVLLLEVAAKLLDKDQDVHKRNHTLFEPYQQLLAVYRSETATAGVDFSDRLQILIDRIVTEYSKSFGSTPGSTLSQSQVTNILYTTTLPDLRRNIQDYTSNKKGVYILFDNLDKGWNANGLEAADIVIIRTLLDASRKLENDFRRSGVDFHCTVFLRNDIYDILLSETSDRGKETRVLVDWSQADLLKHMVRRRLIYALGDNDESTVEALWYQISVSLIDGENSLDHLVRHSLMRPRYLLRLINHCVGNAVNFGRDKVDEADIRQGISSYSTDVVTEIDLEIRDVFGKTQDVLYAFLGEARRMRKSDAIRLLASRIEGEANVNAIYTLLVWHGVLGLRRAGRQDATYIYDVNYDMRRMAGLIEKDQGADPDMELNPGLWAGLELT